MLKYSIERASKRRMGYDKQYAMLREMFPLDHPEQEALKTVKYVIRHFIRIPAINRTVHEDIFHIAIWAFLNLIEKRDHNLTSSQWRTYVRLRVTGAIQDFLRSLDVLSRKERCRLNHLKNEPLENVSPGTFLFHTPELGIASIVSLNYVDRDREDERTVNIQDFSVPDYISKIDGQDILLLAKSILPPRHWLALKLYYFNELTMKQVGKLLHVSEGRISQLITDSLDKLRIELKVPTKIAA